MAESIKRVRDLMQTEVAGIEGMACAREAAEMMRERGVEELLVSKRSDSDAWGIVSIIDLVNKVLLLEKDPETTFVYEIMTKPVVAVGADMDIRYAIRLMQRIGVRRAPVESKGEVVGMLNLSSLILQHNLLGRGV